MARKLIRTSAVVGMAAVGYAIVTAGSIELAQTLLAAWTALSLALVATVVPA
jgi:hypothetical protein